MDIIFMGTPDFSVPILKQLLHDGHNVKAVVTQPDRPKGRKRLLTAPPVKEAAIQSGLPVIQPESIKSPEVIDDILAYNPDLIVTAAYGQILPESLLNVPRLGCINVHASLLPKYRGAAPIHQSIIDGEKETGITIMYMVKALDAGDIISQSKVAISDRETTGTLHDKLSLAGAELLSTTLKGMSEGAIDATPQDQASVTFAPTLKRDDERIDWSKNAIDIDRLVRGLHPAPGAFTTFRGEVFKIWQAKPAGDVSGECGEIFIRELDRFLVVAGEGTALELIEIQPAGKKKMLASPFVRGQQFEIGERFGE